MNKEKFTLNIKGLIANGRVSDALSELSWFIQKEGYGSDLKNTVVLLSSRFNQLQKEVRLGVISHGEENISKNQINFALLELLDEIEKSTSKSPKEKTDIKDDNIVRNVKNVVVGSVITAKGGVHIGDVGDKMEQIHHGTGDNVGGNKIVVNFPNKSQADEKTVESLIQNQSKIKILFLAANPLDTSPLRLDKEMRDIETEIIRSRYRDKFEFIKITAVRIKDLQDALLNHSPHFVHFSGHGTNKGIALLDNHTEKTQLVQSEPLANLFRLFSNDVACVFLNSCYSESQANQIRKYIPNVIGMNSVVNDNTAVVFATSFYQVIGTGREIRFAYEFAKNSIDLNNISGSDIPIYLD